MCLQCGYVCGTSKEIISFCLKNSHKINANQNNVYETIEVLRKIVLPPSFPSNYIDASTLQFYTLWYNNMPHNLMCYDLSLPITATDTIYLSTTC